MVRRMVIGDIHGQVEALKEVLEKSKFNYKKDRLIILGDVVDGGYNSYLVIEELLKIKKKILIIGNHDEWFMNHIRSGWAGDIWLSQGGKETISSYIDKNIPVTHQEFFNRGKYYHIEDNMLFVHGGFDIKKGIENTNRETLVWDRDLINYARKNIIKPYKLVFVGHTTTQMCGSFLDVEDSMAPIKFNNLIMMDCGAGWSGKLAIMDIDTQKFWTSKQQIPIIEGKNLIKK